MSVSLSKILTCYFSQLYSLKRWIYYRCFEKTFSENMQASATNVSCGVSELVRTAILKNNQGQLFFNEPLINFG